MLAAANANASLEEIRKRSEEDKAVWQRGRGRREQGAECSAIASGTASQQEAEQNMPGKACDTGSFFKQIAGLSRQGDEAAIVQGMFTHCVSMDALRGACAWICGNVTFYVIPAVSRASVALEDCQKWAMVNQQYTYAQANMQQEWMKRWAVARKGNSNPLAYEAIRDELHGILVDV